MLANADALARADVAACLNRRGRLPQLMRRLAAVQADAAARFDGAQFTMARRLPQETTRAEVLQLLDVVDDIANRLQAFRVAHLDAATLFEVADELDGIK